MARSNLSNMATFGVLTAVIDGITKYWCGHSNWTSDAKEPTIFVLTYEESPAYIKFIREVHYIDAVMAKRDHTFRVLMMPDNTWVVLDHASGHAHRIFLANVYGEGWYLKNEGSIEKELVIHRHGLVWDHIKFRGEQIMGLDQHRPDYVMYGYNCDFHIPSNGNLVYQFEYETEPYTRKTSKPQ